MVGWTSVYPIERKLMLNACIFYGYFLSSIQYVAHASSTKLVQPRRKTLCSVFQPIRKMFDGNLLRRPVRFRSGLRFGTSNQAGTKSNAHLGSRSGLQIAALVLLVKKSTSVCQAHVVAILPILISMRTLRSHFVSMT